MNWPRAIILVDMNAFFASIEQQAQPELYGKPVAVTNGEQGTCIITSSYEARAYGIKTGMRLKEARQLCPELIQCPARPKLYTAKSKAIMSALEAITPDIEIFSVDEAFLDVTHCQDLWGDPEDMAKWAKKLVWQASGLPCSIGLSGDKTTAKYAAKRKKPNGLTVVHPAQAKLYLHEVPVTELCGIADGIGGFLARYGVFTCGDMAKLPISILGQRYGNIGRRIWYMCQGADPDPIHPHVGDPKSMGHGKVMPPRTQDKESILTYLLHMSEKLGTRLRRHQMAAQKFFIGLRQHHLGWIGGKYRLAVPSDDGQLIYQLGQQMLAECWLNQPVGQVQVTALDPKPHSQQLDLFAETNEQRVQVNQVMDAINDRYGEFTLAQARLLARSAMPNVIAPAWKPYGHRDSI